MDELLTETCRRAANYLRSQGERGVAPAPDAIARLSKFDEPIPQEPGSAMDVLSLLDEIGSPATVLSTASRYFGFVTGGTLPAALAANWIAGTWDQNSGFEVMSPIAAKLETVVIAWVNELFGLPASATAGFVTGATMANFTCLAAARHVLLQRSGWDVEDQGLFGAPELTVVVGDEVHVSLLKALSLLGLGRSRVTRVPADTQGRMIVAQLPALSERTIVCLQAGNVNTGAFDPASEICARARDARAWVHVDGAFGLWAAAAPARAHLMAGFEQADSWAVDCHKWLNVPYDSGLALVRDAAHLRAAMALSAAYLQTANNREPSHYTPESSRRARAIEVWAALRSLGRRGLSDLIEGNCGLATRFAKAFHAAGYQVLNDVVLNQVLVSFGTAETTRRVVAEVQKEGICWCGGTEWHGHAAMRISVSGWATTECDVDACVTAIVRVSRRVSGERQ